jgi:uncharacterized protein with ATP-grasp and redox domains
MNIEKECLECIYAQANRVCELLEVEDKTKESILAKSKKMIDNMSFLQNPPQNATPMYSMIAKELKIKDLYKDIKIDSIKNSLKYYNKCQLLIDNSHDKLTTATKVAIVGNVIDFASQKMFDLGDEVDGVIDSEFSIDDSNKLNKEILVAKNIVYLADNAGEDVFDKLYIKTIKEYNQDVDIFYFVRGEPIINDLTVDDLSLSRIDEVCEVVDSGVLTPGIVIEDLTKEAKKIFDSADIIISKGMGNYECLSDESSYNIFFLLKIKCEVVANALNSRLGNIICKKI